MCTTSTNGTVSNPRTTNRFGLNVPWFGRGAEIGGCHGHGLQKVAVLAIVDGEQVLVDQVGQLPLAGEELDQIGGQDAVLDVAQHLLVLVAVEFAEDVVAVLLQDRHRLVEVVVLHGRCRVNVGQRRRRVQHELHVQRQFMKRWLGRLG